MKNINKEFLSVFQISKMVVFKVNYYTCGNNEKPYFSTSAALFVRNKRDYSHCGQCQNEVLPKGAAKDFFKKWDKKHLSDLTNEEYTEMTSDLSKLKEAYNNIYIEKDTFKNQKSHTSFYEIKELSMQKVK